jgi:probable F420-dependent oxidoreductase
MYGRLVDPFVALARASAVTKTIRLGTGICLVPERNPLLLAKEVATLDRLSGGRFIFGVGAGWLKEETEIMGGDFAHRWTQTKDAILAMKELWTKDEAAYHGEYYTFPKVRSFPKPVQKPHPPVLIGGLTKSALKRVIEWGDGWLPALLPLSELKSGWATLREMAKQAGRNPQSLTAIVFGQTGEYRTRTEVRELAETGISHATIWLTAEGESMLREMEDLARNVLEK